MVYYDFLQWNYPENDFPKLLAYKKPCVIPGLVDKFRHTSLTTMSRPGGSQKDDSSLNTVESVTSKVCKKRGKLL